MDSCKICSGFPLICLHILMGWFLHMNAEGLYVRVVDGANGYQGKVEVYDNGTNVWYPICRDTWDDHAANVVCRMLGYTRVSGLAINIEHSKLGWNKNVSCKGDEAFLSECELIPVSFRNCYVAGVDCSKSGRPDGFFLMGGNGNVIRMNDMSWAYIKIPKPDSTEIRGLSYDSKTDAIYWTDRSNVKNLSMATGNIATMFSKGINNDEYLGLAVDTYKHLLFFGDHNNADIWKVDLDNNEKKVKIMDDATNVQHIEVDPEKEKIYWLELHDDAVREADYNGKNARIVLRKIIYFGLTEIFTLDDGYVYIANKKAKSILVYGRSVISKRYIDISMHSNYKGITQWNDHIYLISSKKSRLIKVSKDGSSVVLTGPLIKDFDILTNLRHYTSRDITISTSITSTTKSNMIDTTAHMSPGSSLQPTTTSSDTTTSESTVGVIISTSRKSPAIDTAASSLSTVLPPPETSSIMVATRTTTFSQTTSPTSTLQRTTRALSDNTTSDSTLEQTTIRITTTSAQLSPDTETIVIAVVVAVVALILGIGLGIFIYRRCCSSLPKNPLDKDNYLTPISKLQEQEKEDYDMLKSANTVSNNVGDEPVYCEILEDNRDAKLNDKRFSDTDSDSLYLEPVSGKGTNQCKAEL